jgi:hypothetical protein
MTDKPNPLSELLRLSAPGVLGFYTHVEVTELFATLKGQAGAVNVFTIAVAEDRNEPQSSAVEYLNPARIRLPSLRGWSFGLQRYVRPFADLVPALEGLASGGFWRLSGEALALGKVTPLPPTFVSPDPAEPVPLNRVLKNNFWNGSHVFELSDPEKKALRPLFDKPPRLQELSEAIAKHIPIGLASLSDRLGNLLIQLPVTTVIANFSQRYRAREFTLFLAWHPKATPRPLRASCALDFDGALDAYASTAVEGPETTLPMRAARGEHRGIVWDDLNRVVLADTGPSRFITQVGFNMLVPDPEPRTFTIARAGERPTPVRVGLIAHTTKGTAGSPVGDDTGGWTEKRMYRNEMEDLKKRRVFIRYRPRAGQKHLEHGGALEDLRRLINQHGENGAWLWDPYLDGIALTETLFHCMFQGVDLRALSDPERPTSFIAAQQAFFQSIQSNWRGLRLEFRARNGEAGWAFHDRFLIFPRKGEGALVWSLGTSVNQMGMKHHILQRIDDGQLVADEFDELWNCLSKPEHLVWKKP